MDTQQVKKMPKRSTAVSGSLAYYNLLAGINFVRTPVPMTHLSVQANQAATTKSSENGSTESVNN